MGNNPHPARGRKRCHLHILTSFQRNNPHPARGRKHHSNTTSRAPCYRNNPHPARGRKPSHFALQTLHPRNNPHPARGRKLFIAQLQPLIVEETTHTPQGDGNPLSALPYLYLAQETTHTPQGDGNPRKMLPSHQPIETTHTPQGDGNTSVDLYFRYCWGNNPHPARGRKRLSQWSVS